MSEHLSMNIILPSLKRLTYLKLQNRTILSLAPMLRSHAYQLLIHLHAIFALHQASNLEDIGHLVSDLLHLLSQLASAPLAQCHDFDVTCNSRSDRLSSSLLIVLLKQQPLLVEKDSMIGEELYCGISKFLETDVE